MCDYSLMGIPNRLADEGENLIAHRFPTGAVGFASSRELCSPKTHTQGIGFWSALAEFFLPSNVNPIPAVCVPPGARLILKGIPARLQRDLGIGSDEEVTFTQLSASEYVYRDAIRFTNGREILLQKLPEGQRVKVLNLSPSEAVESRAGSPFVSRQD